MPRKLTTEEFIQKSKNIHANKYLYDKCNYVGNRFKVIITCKVHGDFYQLPHNHLEGKGCQECGGSKKHNKESFIEKSKIRHKNRYNYNLVNYVNSKTKVKIICPIHGLFEQSPLKHIGGSGCQICGGTIKSSLDDFIEKANNIHNFEYNYQFVNYQDNKTKINICCKKHGIFHQIPSNHLKGVGCPKCSNKHKPSNEEFIEKANKIHNFLYRYNNVKYINCKTEVEIECLLHGIFKQTPNSHLRGRGCKICNTSHGEIKIESILKENDIIYLRQFSFNNLVYKKALKFDFAIFDDKNELKCLIEYNGEQHYNFRGQFGMKEEIFDECIVRDNLKIKYCEENKINIFTIRYDEDVNLRMSEIMQKIEHSSEFSANLLV